MDFSNPKGTFYSCCQVTLHAKLLKGTCCFREKTQIIAMNSLFFSQ